LFVIKIVRLFKFSFWSGYDFKFTVTAQDAQVRLLSDTHDFKIVKCTSKQNENEIKIKKYMKRLLRRILKLPEIKNKSG
jgi:hypothetical protein